MSSHVSTSLTLGEMASFAILMPIIIVAGTFDFLRRTWLEKCISFKTVKRNLQRAFTRQFTLLSLTQARALIGGTSGQVIARECEARGLHHLSLQIDVSSDFPPATLHFIDCEPKEPGRFYLYFHGGGYCLPFQHLGLPLKEAIAAGASLSILEYSLAPEHRYPTQLAQAAAALRLLLQSHPISDIIIGGDSAGANLTLALLAHLREPHPRITPVCGSGTESRKLLGAIATSPRTSDRTNFASITTNAGKDYMTVWFLKNIILNWQPLPEVWAGAAHGDATFWSDIRAERVLLLVGGDELYRDGVIEAGKIMGAGGSARSPVELVVCPGEVHVQMGIDLILGIDDGYMLKTAISWFRFLRSLQH
ncbi:lipase/esterase, putative [Beauveria bassiana ARSEF 2860]|uniref:Lipase/esterase, putative n=1 Tax=Beauveria bassiana (strain ARSEF 2860) TaxID=655819 RepID=J5JED8_BEAB2|nr:lipase/esterase, putative [Beauveria bassiana ARSEF 2860]EJP62091.1 lipase/esterase, putative [Beauveria bassiana ARSEF 2860]